MEEYEKIKKFLTAGTTIRSSGRRRAGKRICAS